MEEYLLTWDGAEGRIISGGFRLMTDERFALPFDYEALYYEPEAGNALIMERIGEGSGEAAGEGSEKSAGAVSGEGSGEAAGETSGSRVASRRLTSAEIQQIRAFCDTYWQEHDFAVQAYSEDSGLYEGEMPKSAAERSGFAWRVNEIPEHPASRWSGERWERVAMAVLDDGTVLDWPEGLCARCVLGLTAEEKAAQVPDRPDMYHIWDIATGTWKDPRTLERAKRDAASSLRVDFELVRHARSADGYFTPSYETETWTWQVMEARAFLADENAATPYIDAFLAARTDEGRPDKKTLCEDILANHAAFLATMAAVNGAQWGYLSRVKSASSHEECLAAQKEAHEFCVNLRRTLEV